MELAGPDFLEALQALGLYVEARAIAADDDRNPSAVSLQLAGYVGDVAFSPRVLEPEADRDEEILDDIADATVADEFERTRRRLLGLDDGE